MICKQCGAVVSENEKFCGQCGTPTVFANLNSSEPIDVDVKAFVEAVSRSGKQVSTSRCLSRAWALVKSDYSTFFGVTLVAMLCMSVPILNFFLIGGLYYYNLGRIRGQRRKLEDLFVGFQRNALQLILGGLVLMGITLVVVMVPGYTLTLASQFLMLTKGADELPAARSGFVAFGFFGGVLLISIASLILSVFVNFMFPLIIDRRLKFGDAIKISCSVACKHFWELLILYIACSVIGLCGLMCCYIGAFFVTPFTFVATAFAYEDLFGEVNSEQFQKGT